MKIIKYNNNYIVIALNKYSYNNDQVIKVDMTKDELIAELGNTSECKHIIEEAIKLPEFSISKLQLIINKECNKRRKLILTKHVIIRNYNSLNKIISNAAFINVTVMVNSDNSKLNLPGDAELDGRFKYILASSSRCKRNLNWLAADEIAQVRDMAVRRGGRVERNNDGPICFMPVFDLVNNKR